MTVYRIWIQNCNWQASNSYMYGACNSTRMIFLDHSVFNTVLLWCSGWGVQTVRCYPDQNWLCGLCHHLPHKSDAVKKWAAIETFFFFTLLEIEPGTLCSRVKDLNHCALLLNVDQPDLTSLSFHILYNLYHCISGSDS